MTGKISETVFTASIPLPMCVVDSKGKIASASPRIGEVFLYDGIKGADVFALTGIKHEQLLAAAEEEELIVISRNQKTFKISPAFLKEGNKGLVLYFTDITVQEEILHKYENEKTCIAIVNVDNYDELVSSTSEEKQSILASEIDKKIRAWALKMNASLTKYKEHMFIVIMSKFHVDEQSRNKFSVLDEIREIETEADFPVTLSIGIGTGGENPNDIDICAEEALDVALGRGGDQAVIKNGNKLSYYGGKTQTVEKSNKGKSRIIGHALVRLIETSSKVLIMGHKNPDMDSFGSALGIYRLAKPINKETYIIVNKHNEALELIYNAVKETGEYDLITNNKAGKLVDERTLVIVVDTHRPSITEFPELLEKAEKSVVIDHHRKAEEFIKAPTLAYTEPYASSTSELVTEILQYTIDKKTLRRIEAEALMSGILVDTNRFSVKTGVRTFEAAAWLRRAGADMTAVKRFFQINKEIFQIKANGIAAAEFMNDMVFSICDGKNTNAQIINSLIADELLNIRGVTASFVAGMNENGRTIVSARSIGNFNVQIIMENFKGGGHMNTAGAQMDLSPQQAIELVKKIVEKTK